MGAWVWEPVARGLRELGQGVRPVTVSGSAVLSRPQAELRATYVADLCEGANWTLRTLDTGHWPMVSAPDQLVALLAEVASEQKE